MDIPHVKYVVFVRQILCTGLWLGKCKALRHVKTGSPPMSGHNSAHTQWSGLGLKRKFINSNRVIYVLSRITEMWDDTGDISRPRNSHGMQP